MRIAPALALSAALLTGACTNQYGEPDPGATLGLVAGAAALGGLAYLATKDDGGHKRHHYAREPRRQYGGYGYGHGYGRHRGW